MSGRFRILNFKQFLWLLFYHNIILTTTFIWSLKEKNSVDFQNRNLRFREFSSSNCSYSSCNWPRNRKRCCGNKNISIKPPKSWSMLILELFKSHLLFLFYYILLKTRTFINADDCVLLASNTDATKAENYERPYRVIYANKIGILICILKSKM